MRAKAPTRLLVIGGYWRQVSVPPHGLENATMQGDDREVDVSQSTPSTLADRAMGKYFSSRVGRESVLIPRPSQNKCSEWQLLKSATL